MSRIDRYPDIVDLDGAAHHPIPDRLIQIFETGFLFAGEPDANNRLPLRVDSQVGLIQKEHTF